jgi:hypothetical protein
LSALVQLLSPNVNRPPQGSGGGRQVPDQRLPQLIAQYAVRGAWCSSSTPSNGSMAKVERFSAALPDLEDARVVVITTTRPGERLG